MSQTARLPLASTLTQMWGDMNLGSNVLFFLSSLVGKSKGNKEEREKGGLEQGSGISPPSPPASPVPVGRSGPVRPTKVSKRAHPYKGICASEKPPNKTARSPASKPASAPPAQPIPLAPPVSLPQPLAALPVVEDRPSLTEEEKVIADAVVGFARNNLCEGDSAKATFGGSLNRILKRTHPAIYLHDIPLDKKFAKTFHAKYNKEYLKSIVSRSQITDKRQGDKGNGMCILNRLKKSDEKELDSCIKRELK